MSQANPGKTSKDLESLRDETLLVTKAIVKLVKKRQDLATKIAQIKNSTDIPIENLEVERKLKQNLIEYASKIRLDEDLALKIADLLLEASKIEQRREVYGKRIISFLEENGIESISIVGAGRMGGWFACYFKALGKEVILYDRNISLAKRNAKRIRCKSLNNIEEIATKSDLIVVAIPISETPQVIKSLEGILGRSKEEGHCRAIIEVSSVKTRIAAQKLGRFQVPVVSIHPLFGPSSQHFGSNSILVIRSGRSKNGKFFDKLSFVKHLFPQFGVFEIKSEDHDMQMALMLSLPHAMALAFGDVVTHNSSTFIKNKVALTSSYSALRNFAAKVLSENPDVYYEIQSMNKFTQKAIKALGISTRKLSRYFNKGNRYEFKRFFENVSSNMKEN
jgi:chorismate mutase/prephenate dehydrogenase